MTLAGLLALAACQRQHDGANAAPAAASAPPTTITALVWAPDWPDEMHKVAAEFTRQNPDVRVNVQFMIGNSVEENIKPKIASRNLPDLMSVNPNAYAAGLAEQGVLADVGHTAAWGKLLPSLKSDWMTQNGKRFGIAGGVAATVMYYNKGMFAQAGITRLPTNFSEFLDVCARLKKAGFTPIVWNGGFPNILGNGPFSFGFANNVVARTPDWKARIADGTLNLANAGGADIFAKIRLVAQRGYAQPGYMHTGYDEGINDVHRRQGRDGVPGHLGGRPDDAWQRLRDRRVHAAVERRGRRRGAGDRQRNRLRGVRNGEQGGGASASSNSSWARASRSSRTSGRISRRSWPRRARWRATRRSSPTSTRSAARRSPAVPIILCCRRIPSTCCTR